MMIEKFDYNKYLKLWEENQSEEYYNILVNRVIYITRIITEKLIKERPNYHPSDDDEYEPFRVEANIIRKKLKLNSNTPQQVPPDNIAEIRESTKVIPKK
jgi:hypothetical protein